MELYMRKTPGTYSLICCSQDDLESLKGLKADVSYKVKIKEQRNYKLLKKYFALMRFAFDHQDKYTSIDAMRAEIIMRTGRFVAHHHLSGKVSYTAASISFDKMEEGEFRKLCSDSIDVILEHFCLNMTDEALWQVIEFD